jgi:hypothetical protein
MEELQMKHLITLGFLLAAGIMYGYGEMVGSSILFCLGGLSEVIFWKRVLDLRKDKRSIPS